MPETATSPPCHCTAPCLREFRSCRGSSYGCHLFRRSSIRPCGSDNRLVLRLEIEGVPGRCVRSAQAVGVRLAVDEHLLRKVAMGGRRGRLPFERCRLPRVVALDALPGKSAIEEVENERELKGRQRQ